jgi:hypothetical protein
MKKITFRKPMFQLMITIYSITIRLEFLTVLFSNIDSFGNMSIESISMSGPKNPSETNAKFRILKVEL